MPTGILVYDFSVAQFKDTDILFRPIGEATPIADIGVKAPGGQDLSQRYYPSTSPDDQIGFNTNIKAPGGADIRTLYQRFDAGDVTPPQITGGTVLLGIVDTNVGAPFTLTVTATGTAPLTYQWLKNGEPISGATSLIFTVSNAQLSDSAIYTAQVTNAAGTASVNCSVFVTDIPPVITGGNVANPYLNLTYRVGDNINLVVGATGTNLNYQWFFNGSPVGFNQEYYNFNATSTTTQSGPYKVVVFNTQGSVEAGVDINIVDTDVFITGGNITGGPYTVSVTNVVEFTVTATGSNLSYQWFFNSLIINGATSPTYSFVATNPNQSGSYSVSVSNTNDLAQAAATLNVVDIPPTITGGTVTGGPYTINVGDVANFNVTATGTNLQYQWYFNGNAIFGANSSSYAFTSNSTSQSGNYQVIVSNGAGSANATASLTVQATDTQPVITGGTVTNGPYTLNIGNWANFTVVATGGNLQYQWYFNSDPIPGATGSAYSFTVSSVGEAGTYTVLVQNNAGSAQASAGLSINPP